MLDCSFLHGPALRWVKESADIPTALIKKELSFRADLAEWPLPCRMQKEIVHFNESLSQGFPAFNATNTKTFSLEAVF